MQDEPAQPEEQEPIEEQEPAPEGAATATPEGAPSEEQPPAPETVTIDGRELSLDEARTLVQFYEWAAVNQDTVNAFGEVIQGRARIIGLDQQPPAEPTSNGAPAVDELEDVPEAVKAKLGEFDQMRSQVEAMQRAQFEQAQAQHLQAIEQATANFQQRYGLDETTSEAVQRELAQLGILPLVVQRAGGDVIRGTEEALELAYFRNPQNRQRELDRVQAAAKDADARQRKASRLSGSSGTSPRQSTPTNPQERLQAMIDDIRAAREGEAVS